MTDKEIIENNKLIAEFMGFTINKHWNNWFDVPKKYQLIYPSSFGIDFNCKFNTSWDWLMPVVEKIEMIEQNGLYYNFQILGGCSVYIISSDMEEILSVDNGDSKLHNVWLAVVEFIKWYNENKEGGANE